MRPHHFAFQEFDYESEIPVRLPYDKFFKTPIRHFEHSLKIRVPDHEYKYNDRPFEDSMLLKAVGNFVTKLNKALDEDNGVWIHIPEREGRDIVIFSDKQGTVNRATSAIREILFAYADNQLSSINPGLLADEHSNRIKSEEEIAHAYVDMSKFSEESTGRIKFDFNIAAKDFRASGELSFAKLKRFLQSKLDIRIVPSPHDTCVDLVGKSEDITKAHMIGREAASEINHGNMITEGWLNHSYKKACKRVGIERVERILNAGFDRNPPAAPQFQG